MNYKKITLNRDGILCPVDEKIIKKELLQYEEIKAVHVKYRDGEVEVEYDPDATDPDSIKAVLDGIGYKEGEGIGGFWLDVLCAVLIVALYILIPKLLTALGIAYEGTIPALPAALGTAAGFLLSFTGLKMWGALDFLNKLHLGFTDRIPKHYNKWVYKIGTMLITELGLLMFFISVLSL